MATHAVAVPQTNFQDDVYVRAGSVAMKIRVGKTVFCNPAMPMIY